MSFAWYSAARLAKPDDAVNVVGNMQRQMTGRLTV